MNTLRVCGTCGTLHYGITRAHAAAMARQSGERVDAFERCANCGGDYRDFVNVAPDYRPARHAIASPIIVEVH